MLTPVMLLPLRLLVTVRISLKQKLGLACLFSLGIIVIVFAFVRLSKVTKATAESQINPTTEADGPILLSLWSTIEAAVSVIVANLPAFRALLRNRGNTKLSNTQGDPGTGYPTMVGSKGTTSRSAIVSRGVELESLHSFEEELGGKSTARLQDVERSGEGDIVMTRHVTVESRQCLAEDDVETSRVRLGLPRT
jgi:hypothetical protein